MSFKCNDCFRTIRTIAEVRNCSRCQSKGRSASIPSHHSDSDWLTPALIGYALGGGFTSHSHESNAAPSEPVEGGGGTFGGGGASGSWDSGSSSSDSSSDSSSSDSGSSDSGSSGGSSD